MECSRDLSHAPKTQPENTVTRSRYIAYGIFFRAEPIHKRLERIERARTAPEVEIVSMIAAAIEREDAWYAGVARRSQEAYAFRFAASLCYNRPL